VLLATDRLAETRMPPFAKGVEGIPGGFSDEVAPRSPDYVFLKRRPSAFWDTGVAELLHVPRRATIVIGGGATSRGRGETSEREAFNIDVALVVVRECHWVTMLRPTRR
jgi:nicotinamidase-related amidase